MASHATTQRLLRELKDYAKSPNEALLHLGPVDEDDLLRWEAVLKGVAGSPYEGRFAAIYPKHRHANQARRAVAAPNQHPGELPALTTQHPLLDADLAPEHLVHDGRDLPHAAHLGALEPRVHALVDHDGHPPAAHGPAAGLAAERGCGGAAARWGCGRVGEYSAVLDGGGAVDRAVVWMVGCFTWHVIHTH